LLDNPIFATAADCFVTGLILAGLARLTAHRIVAGLAGPIVFLASYVLTYQRVPLGDGPVDSIAKIFYLAVAGSLVGLAVDIAGGRHVRRIVSVLLPLAVVLWIGQRRFAAPDTGLWLACLGLWLGGAAILWRLDDVAAAEDADQGAVPAFAILLLLAVAFAPVALAGGSSTSLMLSVALGAGLGGAALWEFFLPRRSFTAATLLGVGAGFLAVVATVTLITRQMDYVTLVLLLLVPWVGQAAARLVPARQRLPLWARHVLVGLGAALPVLLVIALVLLRHPDAFSA
jgi:hypothetical protein